MMNWDNAYKVFILVLMVGISVVVADIWAGVVVGASICLAYLIAALIYANRTPHHPRR